MAERLGSLSNPFPNRHKDCLSQRHLWANYYAAGLVDLGFKVKTSTFEVIAAWHSRSSQSAIHLWLIDTLKSSFHPMN